MGEFGEVDNGVREGDDTVEVDAIDVLGRCVEAESESVISKSMPLVGQDEYSRVGRSRLVGIVKGFEVGASIEAC